MKKQMITIIIFLITIFQPIIGIYTHAEETQETSKKEEIEESEEAEEIDETDETVSEDTESLPDDGYIKATDLDIANYQKEMQVGEKQLLTVTVLPLDATDQTIKYNSSNKDIAEINELGRITAIKVGTTEITIEAADGVKKQFTIKVVRPKSTFVPVEELDLGDYQEEMRAEESQMLAVTVLPVNATDSEVEYSSSNPKVAQINGLGRITALSAGETVIRVRAGRRDNYFTLKVLPEIKVSEIDLGDYRSEMKIGETQMLMPAVFPQNITNPKYTFESSNTKVASINALGRIRTHSEGQTVLTITCEGVKKQFTLTVKKKEEIKVEKIDLGDYQKTMKIGDSQMIMPSVLPTEASGKTFEYKSMDEEVATINGFGRINALSLGETKIIATVDGIRESFVLKVEEREDNSVTDIEIGEYEEEMEVDSTQNISANVVPANAENSKIEYISSNENVATISSNGEIKALEKGSTSITIKAGDVTKQIKINVVVETTKIDTNKTFLVLREGEKFQLECKVFPKEANQKLEYTSTNSFVIDVDNSGLITALDAGEAAVIVTNGYMQRVVNVIANTKRSIVEEEFAIPSSSADIEDGYKEKFDDETIVIDSKNAPVISSDLLKHLYDTKSQITIEGNEYKIKLDGNDVVNFKNELLTDIDYTKEDEGISIYINEGKNLPGEISILLNDDKFQNAKYLYLFNEAKNQYELLNNLLDQGIIETNVAGKYLLTEKKLNTLGINISFIILAFISIISVIAVYIFTKKKYWFW
ncbi:Ig-like domain-containing protein [Herbivorax sp. ANBcel31]|uniref:Ig-like domain-containing protein n=1 Tax=Herbivorax sp. ANBcel31 TaxID=3069754 RepID=UPI0027B50C21|nr:Ig-like domain-containing protein [Herbivorax sp. ANBcel31]MDQ2086707.1 Ig-like domain-containing protein [Herbivorax sp. ANBcel31]